MSDPANTPAPSERYATQLTAVQGPLYAYVCTLLGGCHDASDVLQEINLLLWRKAGDYDPTRSFNAWAHKIAFYQVLAHRKRRAADRGVLNLGDDALARIAARIEEGGDSFTRRMRLLDTCIDRLPERQRELIRLRYGKRSAVKTISRELGKSANSVAAALYRARQALIECVETQHAMGETP